MIACNDENRFFPFAGKSFYRSEEKLDSLYGRIIIIKYIAGDYNAFSIVFLCKHADFFKNKLLFRKSGKTPQVFSKVPVTGMQNSEGFTHTLLLMRFPYLQKYFLQMRRL